MPLPLRLDFEWENATTSTTLSYPGRVRSAAEHKYAPAKMHARQAAFYRNLIRMAEQTGSRILPVAVITMDGEECRLDAGCINLAAHAGFISPLFDSSGGSVEEIQLAWNPTVGS